MHNKLDLPVELLIVSLWAKCVGCLTGAVVGKRASTETSRCPQCGGIRPHGWSCPFCGHRHAASVGIVRQVDGQLVRVDERGS
jgi:hypothetical protein